MKKINKIYNKNFVRVLEALITQGKIKNKTALANKLNTYNSIINNIINGTRSVTLDQVYILVSEFGINANYLFGASDVMFLKDLNTAKDGE